MAFKLFSRPNRQTCMVISWLFITSNSLFAQYSTDFSVHTSASRKNSWVTGLEHTTSPVRSETGSYDRLLRKGGTILFKTLSPEQYARETMETLHTELTDWKGLSLRSESGVQLLTLHPDQLISLQSLLMGKVYDHTYLRQVILESKDPSHSAMNRELLRQVLALQLNRMAVRNELLNEFRIEFDAWLVTQQMDSSGTEAAPFGMPCGNGMDAKMVYSWKFPVALKALLGSDNTVHGLQDLAVEVLAGSREVSKNQVEDILAGVRMINEAFESGRFLLGWSDQFITCSNSWILRWKIKTPVPAVPVNQEAFSTRSAIKKSGSSLLLEVEALEHSRVLIELYTEKGSRIKKLYHNRLEQGQQLHFPINKTDQKASLIYKVTADGRTYSGLIP